MIRAPAVFLSFAAAVLLPLSVTADPRPITHEDLWLMPRVGGPVVSPDGSLAVFAMAEPAYDPAAQATDLWIVRTDGQGQPTRITNTRAVESGMSWSADSRRLVFSTMREGDMVAQAYVLDLAGGGEAQRATAVPTGVRNPRFSPDGKHILFVSHVYPESVNEDDNRRIEEERRERKYNARVYESFPIRNWDRWLGEQQPRVLVQRIGEEGSRDLLAGTDLIAAPGYSGRVTSTGEELDAVWAPDGRSVVFVASVNRHTAAFAFTHTDLWQVSLDGGEPRRLTNPDVTGDGDTFMRPTFSNDGRSLYAMYVPRTERVYNAARLAAWDWPSGKRRADITLPGGRSVTTWSPSLDGRSVWALAEDAGQEKLYRAPADGGEAMLVTAPERGVYSNLSVSAGGRGEIILANWESATHPPEIVRLDPVRKRHRPLTAFASERIATLDLPELEHFWFESEAGARIHNMLLRPPGFDPSSKYPLLVLMHGGPHTMWRDMWVLRWNYHLLSAPGHVVLLTNYTGSTGFGETFAQAIQGDPFRGPALEINQAADEAIRRYPFIDSERQCAAGASYGGHLANWLQGTTTRYRCLISHAGLVNLEAQWGTSDVAFSREVNAGGPAWERGPVWREQNPIRLAARFQTPTLVTFGELDYRVPINNGLEYWMALQRQQVPSRLVVFPDENHWILKGENSRYFYQEVHGWLARWLQ
ncbi:MAG TPA: S9 family peptidase [Xanthomonadaceae bacterium]|nr:S9 family peptidase [Xanthomonadaceae bacterium]